MTRRIIITMTVIMLAVGVLSATAEAHRGFWGGRSKGMTMRAGRHITLSKYRVMPGSRLGPRNCVGFNRTERMAFHKVGPLGRAAERAWAPHRGFNRAERIAVHRFGPRDGTGYRARALGRGNFGPGVCDGTGPRGFRPHGLRRSW
ncbi:MAG: hypothetical protein AB1792_07435 [Candidatus Zixiibacteriota bacterium]